MRNLCLLGRGRSSPLVKAMNSSEVEELRKAIRRLEERVARLEDAILSEEDLRDLEEARKELREGKTISLKEALKEL